MNKLVGSGIVEHKGECSSTSVDINSAGARTGLDAPLVLGPLVGEAPKGWTPTHQDMAMVKELFVGKDRYAYSVWAPESMHVNIHSFCLHLWALIDSPDGRVLPEFSSIVEGVGRSI